MEQELDKMRAEDVKEVSIQPEANRKDTDFLKEVSLLIDHKFAELVKEKPKNEWVGNTFEHQVKVIQGDVVSSDYSGSAISHSGLWKGNSAQNSVQIIQGTVYGYNPFSDW